MWGEKGAGGNFRGQSHLRRVVLITPQRQFIDILLCLKHTVFVPTYELDRFKKN